MTTNYDEELRELQAQEGKRPHLERRLNQLRSRREELHRREAELGAIRAVEELDVEKLEGRSLANFYYRVIQKMDDKLTKEREEAYEAAVKHDSVVKVLEAVEADIRTVQGELKQIDEGKARYQQLLKEKQLAIQASELPEAKEIWEIQSNFTNLECKKKELKEAIAAGEAAYDAATDIADSLEKAEGWGTWDLMGGGLIADIAKHSHLNSAQRKVERLQVALERFHTELTDVKIYGRMSIAVEGFTHFADFFFDGIFADWSVLNRIKDSRSDLESTRGDIWNAIARLNEMLRETEGEQSRLTAKLEQMVIETEV